MKSTWALAVLMLLVGGCGFHLQGRQPLPAAFDYTYVDTEDEQTDFVQDLRKALIASGSQVIRTRGSSGATIRVRVRRTRRLVVRVTGLAVLVRGG